MVAAASEAPFNRSTHKIHSFAGSYVILRQLSRNLRATVYAAVNLTKHRLTYDAELIAYGNLVESRRDAPFPVLAHCLFLFVRVAEFVN